MEGGYPGYRVYFRVSRAYVGIYRAIIGDIMRAQNGKDPGSIYWFIGMTASKKYCRSLYSESLYSD